MESDTRIIRKGEIRNCVILMILGLLPFLSVYVLIFFLAIHAAVAD